MTIGTIDKQGGFLPDYVFQRDHRVFVIEFDDPIMARALSGVRFRPLGNGRSQIVYHENEEEAAEELFHMCVTKYLNPSWETISVT